MASLPLECAHPRPPHLRVARALLSMFRSGERVDRDRLRRLFEGETGRSDASGAWSMREAFDALELAEILFLGDPACPLLREAPVESLRRLEAFARMLPVQGYRSEAQVELQQFSTPLPLAFLAGLAAEPRSGDVLLEPSAGNGMLAWTAARAGARLILNELDERRRASLGEAFPAAVIFGHDAELIDDLLPEALSPTLVLMNPPFTRSAGRIEDRHAAARHVAAALARLAPAGRLVAIMPESFSPCGSGRELRASIERQASLRLDIAVAPGMFARQGTGVAVRLVVYDKAAAAGSPERGRADDLETLLGRIEALPARSAGVLQAPRAATALPALFARRPAPPKPNPKLAASPGNSSALPLAYHVLEAPAPAAEQVGLYLPYRSSRILIAGASPHPTPLVESLAMGSIAAPRPDHAPLVPPRLVEEGRLSDAQLETIVYAGASFGRDLPGRFRPTGEGCGLEPADEGGSIYRCGYFLGDGTGAGKGRQVAGIILDQWLRGNCRHIWISKNESLLEDARRDWTALGGLPLDIQPLSLWKLGQPVGLDRGILFVTYPTLRSGRCDATRLRQILDWAGEAFEGVIAFDEAHAMANAAGGEGSRGAIKGSEQGMAGLRLQNLLPRARILYASATGASDVNNLAYATRLGLWGPETAFADRSSFVEAIRDGGIAAMELVARDLKAMGLYTARALSFAGVEYDVLEHRLAPEQVAIYDAYADAWAIIHANLASALEACRIVDGATGATLNANARSAAMSRFEGTKQRFFGQLLLSMKLPSLVPAVAADLEAGHAVVVQLVSTAEAMLERRLAALTPQEREALEIDLSPREYVVDYLSAAFPTRQMLVFTDAEGKSRSEPMSDEEGRPVHCRAALRARDALIERLCALPPIGTALDTLIERFGTDRVAEVTGRTRRLVLLSDGRQKVESRSARSNIAETDAFMRGDKRILVFSDAGGTGRSYHACLGARNQARRIHYLLEPGWRADAAIQGLGRTHRTRQASAPLFRPVTTDVRGERRFISTIARRLDSLGALTRGQRQTGGQNLFDPADNLESRYARDALAGWYRLLYAGKLRSATFERFQQLTGLRLGDESGGLREDLPPIQRWLNRLLALRIELQNAIFDEFLGLVEARVAAALEAGTLDLGVETVAVEDFAILDDKVVRTDRRSGATTHLLRIELARRARPLRLERLLERFAMRPGAVRMVNSRSGKAALRIGARSLMSDEGLPIDRYELVRPLRREHILCDRLGETCWEPASEDAFAAAWTAEVREAETMLHRETLHLATGLLLPVWDKLPQEHVQVIRIAANDGRTLLGREIPTASVGDLGKSLGLEIPIDLPPGELAAAVLRSGKALPVRGPEPLTLKRSLVNGSQRLELSGFGAARLDWYKAQGCFTEIIRYRTRLFVPVDEASAVLARLTAGNGS
jgi:predicted RNA methylase